MLADPVRWGFLGAGRIATRALAPAVHAAEGARLHTVGARDPERARALAPRRVAPGYAEVLADPEVEAVYISLTNEAHLPWVVAALWAGKHVLCEKPLGLDAAEVATMHAAAAAADRLLVEAFWYRWHPRQREAERLVLEEGRIGAVRRVSAVFGIDTAEAGPEEYRLDPARGGGALYDLGCYCLSAAAAFLPDAEIVGVRAERELAPSGVDLATRALLELAGGAEVELRCSFQARPGVQEVVVEGDAGRLVLPKPAFSAGPDQVARVHVGPGGGELDEVVAVTGVDAYRLMVEQVGRAVRGLPAYVVDAAHSARVAAWSDEVRGAVPVHEEQGAAGR